MRKTLPIPIALMRIYELKETKIVKIQLIMTTKEMSSIISAAYM